MLSSGRIKGVKMMKKNICIVLNYNDSDETIRFCNYFYQYSTIDNILIIDNCSTDNSVEKLKSIQNEKITLLCSEKNNGYAAGNNVGLKYILEHNIDCNIIISNPDIYVEEDSIKIILDALKDSSVGMSTGLIYTNDTLVSNYGWYAPTAFQLIAHNFFVLHKLLTKLNKSFYLDKSKITNEYIQCNCVPGCFFGITSDTFSKIGLFDERTFLFGEENILGKKIKDCNLKTIVCSKAKIIHYGGHSIKKDKIKKKKSRILAENSLKVYLKYYLNCSEFALKAFHRFFWIAMAEQDVVIFLLRILKKIKVR